MNERQRRALAREFGVTFTPVNYVPVIGEDFETKEKFDFLDAAYPYLEDYGLGVLNALPISRRASLYREAKELSQEVADGSVLGRKLARAFGTFSVVYQCYFMPLVIATNGLTKHLR